MTKTDSITNPIEVATLPLSLLETGAHNPRRQRDESALDGLAASILNDGILQSLTVQKNGGDTYRIIAGGRRFAALSLLEQRGDITGDYEVPVIIRDKKAKADDVLRMATVENVQREALEPMDEAEAFTRLVKDGKSIEDIALQTGVGVATVKRRLALAGLCSQAKKALRKGDLSLAAAQALTLGTHAQQRQVLKHLKESPWQYGAGEVRDHLLESRPTQATAIFPLEKYSGSFTQDLFGDPDTTYFDDVSQFHSLQDQAVEELRADHEGKSLWVEVVREWSSGVWQYDQADDSETSGTLIHYRPSGEVEVHTGLTKRVQTTMEPEVASDGATRARPEYNRSSLRQMGAHKSLAVQAELMSNPRKAKEIAAVLMMTNTGHKRSSITVAPHPAVALFEKRDPLPTALATLEAEAVRLQTVLGAPKDGEGLAIHWLLDSHDPSDLYRAIGKLGDDDLESLLRLLTVLSFGQPDMEQVDPGMSVFATVAEDMGVSVRDWWIPDTEFLSTLRKDQLIAIAHASGGGQLVGAKNKKTDLVTGLAAHFQRCADNADGADNANGWLPDAMQFSQPQTAEASA